MNMILRPVGAALAATVLLSASVAAAPGASAATVSATASGVPGFCSFAGGFQRNLVGTVDTMKVTVRTSRRPGSKVKVRVFVKQHQQTPSAQSYPARLLRGEVVIKLAGKKHRLIGPVNASSVEGAIFPDGWTAKGSFKAPKKATYKVTVQQIVYNVRGGGSGGWGRSHRGFDLVCSGGLSSAPTAYPAPRLTVRTRSR